MKTGLDARLKQWSTVDRRFTGNLWLLMGMCSLAACTSGISPATARTAHGNTVCMTERPLGSHMPRRDCRSRAQIEAERKAASAVLTEIGDTSAVSAQQ